MAPPEQGPLGGRLARIPPLPPLRTLSLLRGLAVAGAVVLLSLCLVAAVVFLLGGDPYRALRALHAGSVGSPGSLAETLIKATPLVLTGLSVAIAFRAGVWNIGAEGQFMVGMLGSAAAALALPSLPPLPATLVALAAGTAAGAAWAMAPALLKVKREVPEVISTIMLNFLAVYLVEYLVRGPMKDPRSASDWSPLLPPAACLPKIGQLLGAPVLVAGGIDIAGLHAGVPLAAAVVPLVWLWLARSRTGFALSAVGQNAAAAQSAGISLPRTILTAFVVSGALAGLAGAIEIQGLIQRLYRYPPGSPGYGFSGIAVALLGSLHPVGVLAAALFFGGLSAGSSQMQRSAGISLHVAYVIQAAVVLLLISLPGAGFRSLRLRAASRARRDTPVDG